MAALFFLAILPGLCAVVAWTVSDSVQDPLNQARIRSVDFGDAALGTKEAAMRLRSLLAPIESSTDDLDGWRRDMGVLRDQLSERTYRLDLFLTNIGELNMDGSGTSFGQMSDRVSSSVDTILSARSALLVEETKLLSSISEVQQASDLLIARLQAGGGETPSLNSRERQARVELRFGARNLKVLATTLQGMPSKQSIDLAEIDYRRFVRIVVAQAALLTDKTLVTELREPLSVLYQAGSGDGNLFASGTLISAFVDTYTDGNKAARQTLVELEILLAREEKLNIVASQAALTAADKAFSKMRNMLVLVGLFSVIVSAFILYWYVHKNLLRRLRHLANATTRLSQGDLSVPIEQVGDDELTAISEGLEVFRANALRLTEKERILQSKTRDLEQVNTELDKFAYVASHDLRAPLRAIENLAGFIREDIGDDIPLESRKHLDLMSRRIKRLDQLLTSLLDYSRVGRTELPVEKLDVVATIAGIGEMILRDEFELSINGHIGPFYSYRSPLEQVVRNLVDNAQKHHDQAAGKISVDIKRDGQFLLLAVRDDGPGIPQKFHERVFGMFQTLKPRDDTEGSGMGLAILQKLADSFGGSIVVKSDPETERGTRFEVRWPIFADADKNPMGG